MEGWWDLGPALRVERLAAFDRRGGRDGVSLVVDGLGFGRGGDCAGDTGAGIWKLFFVTF